MSVHAIESTRGRRWLWLAMCTAACTDAGVPSMGTPTPEPPDYLPQPNPANVFNAVDTVAVSNQPPEHLSCSIHTGPNSVPAHSTVWIVDLDAPSRDAAQTVTADAEGRITTEFPIAAVGDRVRLVTRDDAQHSLPLDAVCSLIAGNITLQPASSAVIDCLRITPTDVTGDGTLVITLENQCSTDLTITRAALRFGAAGFTLANAPDTIPSHGQLPLMVTAATSNEQQGDILLLDVSSAGVSARYALGVWNEPASK